MVTFEDAAGFEAAALRAAAAAGAAGVLAGLVGGVRAGFSPGLGLGALGDATPWAPGLALACAAAAAALGRRRRARAREAGEPVPSRWWLLLAAALAALGGTFAAHALPALALLFARLFEALPLTSALPLLLRAGLACALSGASLGLWVAACTVPVHLARRTSEVDRRLAALRFALGPELRPLAERAAAAHRAAILELRARGPAGALPLRTTLDQLALAALELAARAGDLSRVSGAAQEDQAGRRHDELVRLAGAARDPGARVSLERAAAAQEQLAGRARQRGAGRERLVARLHEEVAELERARVALALLAGAAAEQAAAEVDLLDERLRAGAAAAEAFAAVAAERGGEAQAARGTATSSG